jgi:hypothetical protein
LAQVSGNGNLQCGYGPFDAVFKIVIGPKTA